MSDNPEKHSHTQPIGYSESGSQAEAGLQVQKIDQAAQLCAKNELIDNMIYQIRTLSNAVVGFSDLLSTEPLSQDQEGYVQEIYHAGQGLSVLVNDVLDWVQLLSGKLEINKTKFYTLGIIRDLEKLLCQVAKENGLDYQIVTDPELPACICSDRDRLLKCILNLAVSKRKYTPKGNIRFQIRSEEKGGEGFICFDVSDNHCGITSEEFDRIFEPTDCQTQINEASLSQLSHGVSVTTGLPLVKRLCEALGGTLELADQGLTFSLRIPTGVNPATEPKLGAVSWGPDMEQQRDEAPHEEESLSSAVVLLVEDQQANRTVISLMLEALGVQVETAEDGEEAIVKTEDNNYDLILMDIKMPKMDGYEATRQLRQKGIQTPIVALSAKVFDEQEHHQLSMMFDGFVTKPVDSRKLSETLKKFIKRLAGPVNQSSSEEIAVIDDETP